MNDTDDEVSRTWPMRLFVGVLGSLFLAYGIWCLYTGKAYIVTKYSPLRRYEGLQADFIAWSDICFSGVFFAAIFLSRYPVLMQRMIIILFILTLGLSAVGIFF